MILPIFGFSSHIFQNYEEIKRRLLLLGLTPTGNFYIDKSRLQAAINKEIEKFQLKKVEELNSEQKNIEISEENNGRGAQIIAEQNKFLFGL